MKLVIALLVLIGFGVWLIGAFVSWNMNAQEWPTHARLFCVALWVVGSWIVIGAAIDAGRITF